MVFFTWKGNVDRLGQRFVARMPIDVRHFTCRADFLYVLRVVIDQFTCRRCPGFTQTADVERLILNSCPFTLKPWNLFLKCNR